VLDERLLEGKQLVTSRMKLLLRAGSYLYNPLGLCEAKLRFRLNEPFGRGISFCSWIVLCIFKGDNGEIITFFLIII